MFTQSAEHYLPQAVRAAVIIETDDGARMLYHISGPIVMTTEVEIALAEKTRTKIGFTGVFNGGTMWTDNMPGDTTEELTNTKEIEA